MNNPFELTGRDIAPGERESYRLAFNAFVEQEREAFAELAIVPEQEMRELAEDLKRQYYEEWVSLGGREDMDVSIFFIPVSARPEAAQLLGGITHPKWSGMHDPISRSVVIIVDIDADATLYSARTLEHELAHAYSRNFLLYKPEKHETGVSLELKARGVGLGLATHTTETMLGALFEEYYAVERELQGLERGRDLFPEESSQEKKVLDEMVREGIVASEEAIYTSVLNTKTRKKVVSGYVKAHKIGEHIISEIPDGWNVLRKARVSGDWSVLSRAVNNRFGAGAFKVIAYVNPQDESSCELLGRFLRSTNQSERIALQKEIFEPEI